MKKDFRLYDGGEMMGYVKDWSDMLEGFFGEMFFEAKWMFLIEEGLPVQRMKDGFYDGGGERDRDMPRGWRLKEQWDENEEKQTKAKKRFEELLRLSFGEEAGFDEKTSFAFEKNFVLKNFVEKVSDRESFNRNERGWAYKTEDSEWEAFENKLYGETVYTDELEEAFLKVTNYGTAGGKYGLGIGGEVILPGSEYGGYVGEKDRMQLKRDEVEKILNQFKETGRGQSHEIKIEMVRNESTKDVLDIDETLDMLTERLCNLMAKGADGFYL